MFFVIKKKIVLKKSEIIFYILKIDSFKWVYSVLILIFLRIVINK